MFRYYINNHYFLIPGVEEVFWSEEHSSWRKCNFVFIVYALHLFGYDEIEWILFEIQFSTSGDIENTNHI